MTENAHPGLRHYIAIAAFSLSMIAVQVLLSRILSVMFYYHFAFAGVTFAMLGLAAGALYVHNHPQRFTHARLDKECSYHAYVTALLLIAATVLMVDLSGRMLAWSIAWESKALYNVMMGVIILGVYGYILAFAAIGVSITLLLTYFPAYTGKLYAADLASAALGCIFVLLGLMLLDPVSVVFMLAAMLSLLAYGIHKRENVVGRRSKQALVAVLCCSLFVGQAVSYVAGKPVLHMQMGKFHVIEDLLFERWNSFSHVAIYPNRQRAPFGWGLGQTLPADEYRDVEQYWLKIDADAGTVLTRFAGNVNDLGYLKYDVINMGYHLRDIEDVAVIGVGGGRDILSALVFDAKNITGIEINPAIFEALNGPFAEFTGHLGEYPQVHLNNAEARSYISSHDARYDLIQISLIDTWAATAAGGLTMTENKLYTQEGWREFFAHLNEDGMLAVSRWFVPAQHEAELYRLLSLAVETVHAENPQADARNHVVVMKANNVASVVVSKSPYTGADMRRLYDAAAQYGFTTILAPDVSYDDISDTILAGRATPEFYASLPQDVTPPTDDRPFFFNTARLWSGLSAFSGRHEDINNLAVSILFAMAILVFAYLGYAVIHPMMRLYRNQKAAFRGAKPFVLYFTGIGLGFMFIEIAVMQWLMIFLGHPVYALSVILFTLLLFSGIGSYLVSVRDVTAKSYWVRPLVLCAVLAALISAMPVLREMFTGYGTAARIVVSVLMLMPAALCMGMMFPLGVAAAKTRHAQLLPWFWALNGAASVFASIFAVIVAMHYGASSSYMLGMAAYAMCVLVGWNLSRRDALAAS